MYTDRQRIEDCIIPASFYGVLQSHVKNGIGDPEEYKQKLAMLRRVVEKAIGNNQKLVRRLDRMMAKLNKHFVKHKFTTRKVVLAISEWNRILLDSGAIDDNLNPEYYDFLKYIKDTIIKEGYGTIENFEKIDASALKHVPILHQIAEKEGYFT